MKSNINYNMFLGIIPSKYYITILVTFLLSLSVSFSAIALDRDGDNIANNSNLDDDFESICYDSTLESQTGVTNSANVIGVPDDNYAQVNTNGNVFTLDFGQIYPAGTTYSIVWKKREGQGGTATMVLSESTNNTTYTTHPSPPSTSQDIASETDVITSNTAFRYIRITKEAPNTTDFWVDAIGVNCASDIDGGCVTFAAGTGNSSTIINGTVTNTADILNGIDNQGAAFNRVDETLVINFANVIPSGTIIKITYIAYSNASSKTIQFSQSDNAGSTTINPEEVTTNDTNTSRTLDYTLTADTQYLKILMTARTSGRIEVDYVEFQAYQDCTFDTDNDGIDNNVDADDDNDGILDIIENGNCDISQKEEIVIIYSDDFGKGTTRAESANISNHLYDDDNDAIPDGSYAVVSSLTAGLAQYNRTDQNSNLDANTDQFTGPAGGSSNGRYIAINMINTGNTEFYRQSLTNLIIGADYRFRLDLAGLCNGCNDIPIFRLEVQNTSGTTLESLSSSGLGVANNDIWNRITLNFTASTTEVDIVIFNDQPNGGAGNDVGVDNIVFGVLQCPSSFNDTDGDTILNNLDLDSDDDGCPDAIEAGTPSILITSGINTDDGIADNTENAIVDTTEDAIGTNGFANSLETATDNGSIANLYTTTNYNTYALDDTKNGCGSPMITQVYWKGTEKIIEVTNNDAANIVVPNAANINFFNAGTTTSRTATAVNTAEITAGNSILFSASGSITAQIKSGTATITNTAITAFDNTNDIITISRSGLASSTVAYDSRIDVVQDLEDNTSFVRIDETLVPNTTYTASEWVEFIDDDLDPYRLLGAGGSERHPHDPLLSEITSGVNTEANALLGLHRFGITTRTGSAWSNGFPDRSRFVVIDEDYNHTSTKLSARKLTVNASRKLGITESLVVVTNDVVLNGDIRLIDTSGDSKAQLIQTHTAASLVTGSGRLLVDQNSTVPSLYRYNYVGSPVKNTTGATTYTVASILKDGTTPTNFAGTINTNIAKDITFVAGYDGDTTDPISLADYWVYTYAANAGTRASWVQKLNSGTIPNTDGFIFKGPGRVQNYTFLGIPKDGQITTTIGADESYLVANPYASAISVKEFIEDNTSSISGTLYFWEHTGEEVSSGIDGHYFDGYIGGYATRTITMGVSAKNATGGAIDTNLEAEASTDIDTNGTIENVSDGGGNIDVVTLDNTGEYLTFEGIASGVDTLRIRYKSSIAKTIRIKENGGTKIDFDFPATSGLFDIVEIEVCVVIGSDVTFESLDSDTIQIDYFNLKDDGEITCAPNIGGNDITYTEPAAYIAIGQGFFVQGDDTDGGTVTFNNSQREYKLEGTESIFLKSSGKSSSNSITNLPVIKLGMDFRDTSDGNIYHRQIGISFSQFTSFNYDKGYDAEIYDIGDTDFYWKFPSNDDKYVIAGVQDISEDLEVPLEIIIGYSGDVIIKVDEMKNINQNVYITDKVTGISQEIINGIATLTLDEGIYSDRFVLTFKESTVLSTIDTNDSLNNEIIIFLDNKNEELVIQNKYNLQISKVELFNLLGQKITSWNTIEPLVENRLKTKSLNEGVYLIRVKSNKGNFSKKILFQK